MAEGQPALDANASIRGAVVDAPVVYCDGTSVRVGGKNCWVHNSSTGIETYQQASWSRGSQGILEIGVLPQCIGRLVHDCWPSYWTFIIKAEEQRQQQQQFPENTESEQPPTSAQPEEPPVACPPARGVWSHALCNAHLRRELHWVFEFGAGVTDWAKDMAAFLSTLNEIRKKAIAAGRKSLPQKDIDNYHEVYLDILDRAEADNPDLDNDPSTRDPVAKHRNLIRRLHKRKDEFLAFLSNFEIDFTNNQAERDLRPHKARMAISGCFRKFEGVERYLRLFNISETARKRGNGWFKTFRALLIGNIEEVLSKPEGPAQ